MDNQTVQLRLSSIEKEAIKKAASACGRTVSEYLLECHRVVSRKLKRARAQTEDFCLPLIGTVTLNAPWSFAPACGESKFIDAVEKGKPKGAAEPGFKARARRFPAIGDRSQMGWMSFR